MPCHESDVDSHRQTTSNRRTDKGPSTFKKKIQSKKTKIYFSPPSHRWGHHFLLLYYRYGTVDIQVQPQVTQEPAIGSNGKAYRFQMREGTSIDYQPTKRASHETQKDCRMLQKIADKDPRQIRLQTLQDISMIIFAFTIQVERGHGERGADQK